MRPYCPSWRRYRTFTWSLTAFWKTKKACPRRFIWRRASSTVAGLMGKRFTLTTRGAAPPLVGVDLPLDLFHHEDRPRVEAAWNSRHLVRRRGGAGRHLGDLPVLLH